MRQFDIRNINIRNTYEWTRCNNDGRSSIWRNNVLKYFGGDFVQVYENKSQCWKWVPPSKDEMNKWIFVGPDGNEHRVSNFKGFCKENNLDDGRMYDTYTGKRKHHKKWVARRLYGVESTGSKDFGRNDFPQARS